MPEKLVQMARRRALILLVTASAALGVMGGAIAYAAGFINPQYQHTANGWNHGIDDNHVYMTRSASATSVGTGRVSAAYGCIDGDGGYYGDTQYTAHHIHTDGYNGLYCDTTSGWFNGINPALSGHNHW